MPRPRLPVGTNGAVRFSRVPADPSRPLRAYRARTLVRDDDGRVRPLERTAKTKAVAETRLKEAVRDRVTPAGDADLITAATTVERLAERWYAGGTWAASTTEQYRYSLDRLVIPMLGGLELSRLTTGRADAFLSAVKQKHGTSSAKSARSVLSGMCGLAVRHDALTHNPIRDVSRIIIETRPADAFSVAEARQIRALITYDDKAVARDLPDLVSFMLATSLRIGEAIAIDWLDIDLDAGTCAVVANAYRVKGRGVIRNVYPNNKLKRRVLTLPSWAVKMLRRRKDERGGGGGLVFPTVASGKLRDPSNTGADLRDAFAFMDLSTAKSHMFRKTGSTLMELDGRTPRMVADQLGHSRVDAAQNKYVKRDATRTGAAQVLEALGFD